LKTSEYVIPKSCDFYDQFISILSTNQHLYTTLISAMGEQRVSQVKDSLQMQNFVKSLLKDVKALEYMLANDWLESGQTFIGAEQEMVLIDNDTFKPAPIAVEVLEKLKDHDWVETELARFNIETNLQPRRLTGNCFQEMQREIDNNLSLIQQTLNEFNSSYLLTGILPTFRKFDLEMNNLTPKKRYMALMDAINDQLLGGAYELRLSGIDELLVSHNSPLLEALNTSFQVHLQVSPEDFTKMYNIALALAAPVMAIGANSPIVFGKRLWHETRIAIFQQSIDTRTTHDHLRQRRPRVNFGNDWLQDSILDIYREDIARFRVLISSDLEEDSLHCIKDGKVPKLRALGVHNSTVYRWNRPCYGISANGKPHLRIENRVLPAGPTVLDEMANAVFWLGCMQGMAEELDDIRDHLSFSDVRDNFSKAARAGIDSKFTWFYDEKISVCDLVLEKLLPLAHQGLAKHKVAATDIDKYLSIIEARAKKHTNGARWALRSFTKLIEETDTDEALSILTSSMLKNQNLENNPSHLWELPKLDDLQKYLPVKLKVSEFMNTDLFTVQKDDIIELVSEMMTWRKISYAPVEDGKGNILGLVTSRRILQHLVDKRIKDESKSSTVQDIMIRKEDLIVANQDMILDEAIELMNKNSIGSLPVVKGDELIGIVTETDFLKLFSKFVKNV